MKRKYKRSSKGGFTLIEVIAALAIMAIMVAVVTPKITRYIDEAKKIKALEEVRQVVLAINTYNMQNNEEISGNSMFSDIKNKLQGSDLIDINKVKSISGNMKFIQMQDLIDGDVKFELTKEGFIKLQKQSAS